MHPKVKIARIGGLLYLFIIIFGLIAQIFVRDSLVDYNNATITAKNVLSSEFWYRFGFVSELLMLVCDVGVTTILFVLLKEIDRTLYTIDLVQVCQHYYFRCYILDAFCSIIFFKRS